ncbi:MmcQ/YjbR family DNA-binding protein [Streptomyces althioticus]|uniref:MmcQ/YjbR family DNA-binding protein n=1 Tax=Actinomycetes TaxID=1760 RepID=UPI00193F4504|nr:MmcQ/YjbR family DNA-binding protein [Actinospica acidiphila]MBM4827420.1 MmcQ/YjbR family DNA-binding protein [Actinospica acidiphila]WTC21897.1 MmcQ/YjbR family DNA-binding protein [Streptomyces althioticus]
MAVPRNALRKWEKVREWALSLPGAVEEHPWGDTVAKVDRKVFVFLGAADGSHPLGVTVKLTDETAHAHALACPGAEPAGYGLGKAGWVRVPLEPTGAPAAELLRDWVEESYRTVATKRRAAELDARTAERTAR